jgi:quercetin dioxygenase-like cupin family protein
MLAAGAGLRQVFRRAKQLRLCAGYYLGMPTSFRPMTLSNGVLFDMGNDALPTVLSAWRAGCLELRDTGTHFGYVHEGSAVLNCASGVFNLGPGMYFSVAGEGTVSGEGAGIIVSRHGYRGLFQVGGPVEPTGRLRYIDGCTDSLLVAPVLKGDPCLNLLAFPGGVNQTPHTHPSIRAGIVASGSGVCITPAGRTPLVPGQAFVIRANQLHSFATGREPMRVIAYHPDSDFGPTHEDHPMINRTLVGGESASLLHEIRTKPGAGL